VNVQNIKDAFEHFSDVVVSDFDPFADQKILALLLPILKKSDTFEQFFAVFMSIYQNQTLRDDPESYLDFESRLEKYIDANPTPTADIKAKAAQYFSILNRIEYVIELDAKYRESSFLFFWRKFNMLYNQLHRITSQKDPIEVYFDNQIGMVEVNPFDTKHKKKRPPKIAEPKPIGDGGQFDILKIIAARNEQEAKTGTLIQDFENKILSFFQYVRQEKDGERLLVKIKSDAPEAEIYADFGIIYRRYRALNRQSVGDYFFKETEDLIDKLCDDFEVTVREAYP
jgi:type I restriction enzyme R subunit